MHINRSFFRQIPQFFERNPYWFVLIFSLLASSMALFTRGLVNSDGAFFLSLAEMILQKKLDVVTSIYAYPFFPWLIAIVASLLGNNVQLAADFINAFFFAVAATSFVGILRQLDCSPRVVLIGAVAFLLFPVVNEVKADIYRDPGFIGLLLFSVWMFFRYQSVGKYGLLLAWLVAVLGAALFRIEALVFLLLPLVVLVLRLDVPRRIYLLLFGFSLAAALVYIVLPLCFDHPPFFARRAFNIVTRLDEMVNIRVEAARHAVLNIHSGKHAFGFVLFGSIYLILKPIVNNLGWFLLYGLFVCHKKPESSRGGHLWVTIALALLPLLFQVFYGGFLQARYAMLVSVLLLVFLIVRYGEFLIPRNKFLKALSILFLLALFVDGFVTTGPSRSYQVDAVDWMKNNIDYRSFVISNQRTISYSVHRLKDIQHGMIDNPGCEIVKQYDYYVLSSGKRASSLPDCVTGKVLINTFKNRKGHSLRVYGPEQKEQ